MRRAQSSVEFLLIVAFSLLLLVPATILFLNYNADSQEAVVNSQIFRAANELALTSDLIFNIGTDSWQTIDVVLPADVTDVTVYEGEVSELVFTYGPFDSTIVVFVDIPVYVYDLAPGGVCETGCDLPLSEGLNRVRVEATQDAGIAYIRYQIIE